MKRSTKSGRWRRSERRLRSGPERIRISAARILAPPRTPPFATPAFALCENRLSCFRSKMPGNASGRGCFFSRRIGSSATTKKPRWISHRQQCPPEVVAAYGDHQDPTPPPSHPLGALPPPGPPGRSARRAPLLRKRHTTAGASEPSGLLFSPEAKSRGGGSAGPIFLQKAAYAAGEDLNIGLWL